MQLCPILPSGDTAARDRSAEGEEAPALSKRLVEKSLTQFNKESYVRSILPISLITQLLDLFVRTNRLKFRISRKRFDGIYPNFVFDGRF